MVYLYFPFHQHIISTLGDTGYPFLYKPSPLERKRGKHKIYLWDTPRNIRYNIKWGRGFDRKYGRIIIVKRWKMFFYNNNSQKCMYLFIVEIHERTVSVISRVSFQKVLFNGWTLRIYTLTLEYSHCTPSSHIFFPLRAYLCSSVR